MTLLLVAHVKQEAQLLLRQLALTLSKAVVYLLHKPGSRQVAILAVKYGTTVA